MDELKFKGKTYRRYSNRWVDSNGMVVNEFLQQDLNKEFAKSIDIATLTHMELIEAGQKYKLSGSYSLAVECFTEALKTASEGEVPFLLARLFSCYRKMNAPNKVVEYIETELIDQEFSDKYAVALTSVAAAYCDLREYQKAEKYCKLAMYLAGCASQEQKNVMARIEKELEGR